MHLSIEGPCSDPSLVKIVKLSPLVCDAFTHMLGNLHIYSRSHQGTSVPPCWVLAYLVSRQVLIVAEGNTPPPHDPLFFFFPAPNGSGWKIFDRISGWRYD